MHSHNELPSVSLGIKRGDPKKPTIKYVLVSRINKFFTKLKKDILSWYNTNTPRPIHGFINSIVEAVISSGKSFLSWLDKKKLDFSKY